MRTNLLILFTIIFQTLTQGQTPILTAQFDQILAEQFKPGEPGAAVLVAVKGQVIYKKAIGIADMELNVPLQPDMIFRIGSVTKQFTAVAILQLVEQGKMSLQDEITAFIPDYPTHGKTITVEHLLTHTSGIKSYTEMSEWDEMTRRKDFTPTGLIDFFKNQPMDFDPGTKWNYSNSGYILLGYIIEKVSGKSYGEYVADNFFKPLGMHNSYYDDDAPIIKNRAKGYQKNLTDFENAAYLSMTQPYSAGSLMSTVEDLMIWTKAIHSYKLVQQKLMQKAFASYILPDGTNTHYGYGLSMNYLLGSPTVEHSGGINGFLSNLIYLPKEDVCVAIIANCDCNPPNDVSNKMAALAAGIALTPKPITVDASALDAYVGVYESAEKVLRTISVDKGQLYSQRAGGAKLKLIPFEKDQFYFDGPLARATFVRDASGAKADKVLINDRTGVANVWTRTDKAPPAARKELQLTAVQLDPLTGQYELMPGFNIEVTRKENRLFAQATGQEQFEIFAASETRFFLKAVEADIEFFPDEKGVVSKMILYQGGQEMEGKRVK